MRWERYWRVVGWTRHLLPYLHYQGPGYRLYKWAFWEIESLLVQKDSRP